MWISFLFKMSVKSSVFVPRSKSYVGADPEELALALRPLDCEKCELTCRRYSRLEC